MSARNSFCALAIALAATWLLLPPRHTPAQAPAGESTDQRLRRLEEKIDKLSTVVAELQGGSVKRPAPVEGSGLAALHLARDRFQQEFEAARRELAQFAQRRGPAGTNFHLERLAKLEKRRSELQIALTELQQNYRLVEQAYKRDGKSVALAVLASIGVKTAPEAAQLPEMDAVQATLAMMQVEIDSKKQILTALERSFDQEQKDAVELNHLLAAEQHQTQKVEAAKRAIDMVNRAINEIEQLRGSK
jgi:hypothetical protein